MKTSIPAVQWPTGYFQGMDYFLVRGVTRRAIRVLLRPFPGIVQKVTDEALAIQAAQVAAQKGWKTVVVDAGDLDNEVAHVFNLDQHLLFIRGEIAGGTYLCQVGSVERRGC